jgi:3-oxoacyl-[acyl-carrier protein] reductase
MATQTVLITGGNKGIGLLTSQLFLNAGYHVYVLARDFANFSLSNYERVTTIEYDLINIDGIPQFI